MPFPRDLAPVVRAVVLWAPGRRVHFSIMSICSEEQLKRPALFTA